MNATISEHTVSSEVLGNILSQKKNKTGAPLTIRSKQTGKDYTFKIGRSEFKSRWYTHVKVEQGYLNFRYLGHYSKGKIRRKGQVINTPAAKAIAYVLRRAEAGHFDWLDERTDIMHTGECLSCGKTLTDAESIERGLGPVCATH